MRFDLQWLTYLSSANLPLDMFRRILKEWAEVFSPEQDEHLISLRRGAEHDIVVPLMAKCVFFGGEMVFGEAVG